MVLAPIIVPSIGLLVWINDVPEWKRGEALAQMQFETWYLQPLYPDGEIALSPELVASGTADVREPRRVHRPALAEATTFAAR